MGNEGIGTITATGSTTADFGRLLCQGQALSRTTYARLFNRIGTAFGAGNGSTTFNLPDCREVALVGAGTNVLNASAITSHNALIAGQFQDDQIQDHIHGLPITTNQTTGSSEKFFTWANKGNQIWEQYVTLLPTASKNLLKIFPHLDVRTGTTTHGKQLGINYQIKY